MRTNKTSTASDQNLHSTTPHFPDISHGSKPTFNKLTTHYNTMCSERKAFIALMQKPPYSTTAIKQFLISRMPYAAYSNPKRKHPDALVGSSGSTDLILVLTTSLTVGFLVRSPRGTQFRRRANTTLREYLQKGFTTDDKHLPPLTDARTTSMSCSRVSATSEQQETLPSEARDLTPQAAIIFCSLSIK